LFGYTVWTRCRSKFLELIQGEYDDLARLLSSEHGKTLPYVKAIFNVSSKSSSLPAASRT
jgi:hypothetical protein